MYFFAFLRLYLSFERAVALRVRADPGAGRRAGGGGAPVARARRLLASQEVSATHAGAVRRSMARSQPHLPAAGVRMRRSLHLRHIACIKAALHACTVLTMLSALCSACERLPPNFLHPLLQLHGSALTHLRTPQHVGTSIRLHQATTEQGPGQGSRKPLTSRACENCVLSAKVALLATMASMISAPAAPAARMASTSAFVRR